MIKDTFQVNETIKGYYILEKDGKIVAKGHNTIVDTGRQFLFDVFTSNILGNTSSTYYSEGNKYFLYRLYAGKQLTVNPITLSNTTWEDINNEVIQKNKDQADENFYREFNSNTLGNTEITFTEKEICLSLSFTGQANAQCISTFFITFTSGTDNTEKEKNQTLFSRFVIDPIYLVAGSTYSLKYYIAF